MSKNRFPGHGHHCARQQSVTTWATSGAIGVEELLTAVPALAASLGTAAPSRSRVRNWTAGYARWGWRQLVSGHCTIWRCLTSGWWSPTVPTRWKRPGAFVPWLPSEPGHQACGQTCAMRPTSQSPMAPESGRCDGGGLHAGARAWYWCVGVIHTHVRKVHLQAHAFDSGEADLWGLWRALHAWCMDGRKWASPVIPAALHATHWPRVKSW